MVGPKEIATDSETRDTVEREIYLARISRRMHRRQSREVRARQHAQRAPTGTAHRAPAPRRALVIRLHVGSAASGTAHTADAVQRGSATRRGSSRTARAWRTIAPSTCRWAASSQSACRPGRSRRSSTGHDTASDLARSPPRRLRGAKGRHGGRCQLASWAGVRGMQIQQARARGMGHSKCKQLDDV